MKKLYMLIVVLAIGHTHAQVLNQSANWPSTDWTLTGSYSTDPLALEADPTLTANFAFDDDDATNGHEDNIAAESPVIDLTPAFEAGEFGIQVSVMYGYRYLADDRLIFQYWDADGATWIDWGLPIPGNNTTLTDNFCDIPRTLFTTPALNISGFTATQLSGFRYRISYDDNPNGTDWNYGFCFESPTISSIACFAPTSVMANVTGLTAEISWDGAAGNYEYVLDQSTDDPDSGTTTTDTTLTIEDLDYSTIYYFHVRSVCDGGALSEWTTIQVQTGVANDTCETAINLDELDSPLDGTTAGALNDNGMHCTTANIQRDVFYSITVPNGSTLVMSQTTNNYDSTNVVFYGDCDNRTEIQCWDDPDDSVVTWANTTGSDQTVYWIQDGYGNTTTNAGGDFTLQWELINCANPETTFTVVPDCDVSGGFLISVDVTNMGTATSLTISDNQGNTEAATEIGQYLLGPYDNGVNVIVTVENDQNATCSVTSGTLTQTVCPPANDNCDNAVALTPAGDYAAGAVESTVVGATASVGAPAPGCALYSGGDVWYSVEIPDSGNITIETGPAQGITTFDSGVAVYSGTCDSLTLIECDDDDAATGNFSLISLSGRTPGEVIYIRVWEYFNDETEPFSISAWDASLGNAAFNDANFKAHPNPVTNILNLSYTANIDRVEIYNLVGQQVLTREGNTTSAQIDMSPLPTGTYLVKISSEGASKTVKVLKE